MRGRPRASACNYIMVPEIGVKTMGSHEEKDLTTEENGERRGGLTGSLGPGR